MAARTTPPLLVRTTHELSPGKTCSSPAASIRGHHSEDSRRAGARSLHPGADRHVALLVANGLTSELRPDPTAGLDPSLRGEHDEQSVLVVKRFDRQGPAIAPEGPDANLARGRIDGRFQGFGDQQPERLFSTDGEAFGRYSIAQRAELVAECRGLGRGPDWHVPLQCGYRPQMASATGSG
jgi:hypothetical protein